MQTITYSAENFIEENISQYVLSIRYSTDGLSFCVHDSSDNLLYFAHKPYLLASEQDMVKIISETFVTERLLKGNYKKIFIACDEKDKVLIPKSMFQEGQVQAVSLLSFELRKGQMVQHAFMESENLYLAQPINTELFRRFNLQYNKSKIVNSSYSFIINSLNMSIPDKWQLFADIHDRYVDVLLAKNRKIQLFNSFAYTSISDLVYYLIACIKNENLRLEIVYCYLSGEHAEDEQLMTLLSRYVKNIKVMECVVPKNSEITASQYIHFLNLHRCE